MKNPFSIIGNVIDVVTVVEEHAGSFEGETKLQIALDLLQLGAAAVGEVFPGTAVIAALISGIVKIFNKHGIFVHSTAASAPVAAQVPLKPPATVQQQQPPQPAQQFQMPPQVTEIGQNISNFQPA